MLFQELLQDVEILFCMRAEVVRVPPQVKVVTRYGCKSHALLDAVDTQALEVPPQRAVRPKKKSRRQQPGLVSVRCGQITA